METKSNKIRKASYLIQYISNKIYQSQKISRMLYYNTKNPLSQQGLDYNNKKINQPDVAREQLKDNIFDVGFNPDMILQVKNQIFINLLNGRFKGNKNKLNIDVNILVPESLVKISNGYRQFEIAQSIADIFDEEFISEEDLRDYKNLGALKFELVSVANGRLSKTENYIWFNMLFEVELLGAKYRVNLR